MQPNKKILAICGSTRAASTNFNLIKAIKDLTENIFEIEIFREIAAIPHFNPDLDNEHPPKEVIEFRNKLKEADGVFICTPEYAMGVPGTLKNAIDWTVSSAEFSHKPVALITASSQGEKGHASLMETLKIIESDIADSSQLLISFVKTKVSAEGKITNTETLEQVKKLIASLKQTIDRK